MKRILIAVALLGLSVLPSRAACNVTGGLVSFTLTGQLNEADCASAGTVAAQGTAITGLQGTVTVQGGQITALQAADVSQASAITALQSGHAAQQGEIDAHETRLDNNDVHNATQDGRITATENVNTAQQATIDTHTTQIAGVQAVNAVQDTRLGSLETVTAAHEVRLDAQDALLSQHAAALSSHGKRLDEHDKGLAIAMAMPDAWLSDKKKFGIFGAIGGFNGEAAVGFAAVGRIDETWSLNAKVGSDTGFEQFGWQIGAGAQW